MFDREKVESNVRRALAPLRAPSNDETYSWGYVFPWRRTNAGRSLPQYYLVYFLLVDFLGFRNLGRYEKTAFSIPITMDGLDLTVEYRKFGLGIFAKNGSEYEAAAEKAAACIRSAVRAARPYFDHLADTAASGSDLNVNNNSRQLFERYEFFFERYSKLSKEAEIKKDESVKTEHKSDDGTLKYTTTSFPSFELRRKSRWYATAAIEAFFSWTEHMFILAAILKGKIKTGEDVAAIAGAEWKRKFRSALDANNSETERYYDQLLVLRSQVRNFVAHGAFGKDGQALSFHSTSGAVPLLLPHKKDKKQFRFGNGVDFLPPESMTLISDFINYIWSNELAIAKIYIESELPLILSYTIDGKYSLAMDSEDKMNQLVDHLNYTFGQAANMDW